MWFNRESKLSTPSSPVVQPLVAPLSPVLPTASLSPHQSLLRSTGAQRWHDIEGQKWVLQISGKDALSGNYCGRDPFMPSLKWLVTATHTASAAATAPHLANAINLTLKPFEEESWRSDSGKLLEVLRHPMRYNHNPTLSRACVCIYSGRPVFDRFAWPVHHQQQQHRFPCTQCTMKRRLWPTGMVSWWRKKIASRFIFTICHIASHVKPFSSSLPHIYSNLLFF